MSRRRHAGFTLIELMITLVIVSIITAIAYPSYRHSVLKSRRSDGQVALMDYAQRLERCYTEYDTYKNTNCQAYQNVIGASGAASGEGYYTVKGVLPAADQFTLTATATNKGSQSDDSSCKSMTLDQTGAKTPTACW
jgi:type IV pilus assembly protein PilE